MKPLLSKLSNTDLLAMYGYEPYDGSTLQARWNELTSPWSSTSSEELGHLRQIMLQIHKDLCPDEETWVD